MRRRRRLARYEFLEFFAQLPAATVVMEACGSAHFWGRRIEELGHVVVLFLPSDADLCMLIHGAQVGPARGKAEQQAWPHGRPEKRPQIRLQSVLLAVTASPTSPSQRKDNELTPASHLTGGVQMPLVGRTLSLSAVVKDSKKTHLDLRYRRPVPSGHGLAKYAADCLSEPTLKNARGDHRYAATPPTASASGDSSVAALAAPAASGGPHRCRTLQEPRLSSATSPSLFSSTTVVVLLL